MYYKYNTHNGEVRAFISLDSFNDSVHIYAGDNTEYSTNLYNNKSGELAFNYEGEEILFKDFIKTSMSEIRQKIYDKELVFSNELMQAIICDGIDNVRFRMDMRVPDMIIPEMGIALCGEKKKACVCSLVEEYLHMPHESYKLSFMAVAEPKSEVVTCKEKMYADDFASMLCDGFYEILDSVDDGKTTDEHVMEYFAKVTSGEYYKYKMHA